MGHKHLLVTQLYRLLRGALKQEHAKRLPQGFVQVAISDFGPAGGSDSGVLSNRSSLVAQRLPMCSLRAVDAPLGESGPRGSRTN